MKPFIIGMMSIFFLSGCTHKFTVSDMEGSVAGEGTAQEVSHELKVTVEGKAYSGEWAFDRWSKMGKGIAIANDGAALTCEFIYRGIDGTGLGTCEDKDGKKYSVKVHN